MKILKVLGYIAVVIIMIGFCIETDCVVGYCVQFGCVFGGLASAIFCFAAYDATADSFNYHEEITEDIIDEENYSISRKY